jgi:hypothetical protein
MAPRVLDDPHLRYLRDQFHLKDWIRRPEARRHKYFTACDRIIEMFKDLLDADASTRSVMLALKVALFEDDTFTDFIAGRQGAEFLTQEDNWDKVVLAGAGTVLHEYYVARERGDWPIEEGEEA